MATVPTPEEAGRTILSFFRRRNHRAGEMMMEGTLRSDFNDSRLRAEDYRPAMEWLIENGFIEVRKSPSSFVLTEAGFKEM